ncbi:hypothetical protein VCRA2110O318_40039 [Vibrio crassostreae]|nr:hypothetical protein VCRA2117O328_40039 [Vibrio crassostreae]CAK2334888.1 hypothetical protein VCRA2110O318_40039 [Vibrio crassostreae]CAK2503217.1 hypothetical protein VCRA2110O319_50039 [Vibrio crassostreae]CAK2911971.1 hypothetical protein VCRA217O317_30254 [Vibrio crassostreae]
MDNLALHFDKYEYQNMAIIQKELPEDGKYANIDGKVFRIPTLSMGAKSLYGYLCGIPQGQNVAEEYILNGLGGIGSQTLRKYKKELEALDLVYRKQVKRGVHFLFIGYTDFTASSVYAKYERQAKEIAEGTIMSSQKNAHLTESEQHEVDMSVAIKDSLSK